MGSEFALIALAFVGEDFEFRGTAEIDGGDDFNVAPEDGVIAGGRGAYGIVLSLVRRGGGAARASPLARLRRMRRATGTARAAVVTASIDTGTHDEIESPLRPLLSRAGWTSSREEEEDMRKT